jgi:ParB family chromosome partitioning protein
MQRRRKQAAEDDGRRFYIGIRDVALADIVVLKRLRQFRPELVDQIADSIEEIGRMLDPIVLRPRRTGGYFLVAGWHRLEAARKLGWDTIAASIFNYDATQAQIAEIESNFCVAYLSPAEQALLYKRRIEVQKLIEQERKSGDAEP